MNELNRLILMIQGQYNIINDNIATVLYAIQQEKFSNIVNTRVKAQNSIQYKIQNYELNHENGKIALKKCLNDILGIRMIF